MGRFRWIMGLVAVPVLTLLMADTTWAADAKAGAEIYQARCLKCHGPEGHGNAQVGMMIGAEIPDLGGAEVQKKSDHELLATIAKGRGKMPPFEYMGLSPEDIRNVLAYIRNLRQWGRVMEP
ncbi:MAG: c-type cytochrome [Candidatus Methylomirabilales bacterium]